METAETEDILFSKAVDGDMEAFGSLIEGYERFIFNLAYRMLPNVEDAKDIAQEVLIKIYKNLNKCDDVEALKPWIRKIATNTCIDEIRKRKRKLFVNNISSDDVGDSRVYESDELSPEQLFLHREEWEAALAALHKLPDDSKVLIVLRDIHGLSYNEICGITQINMGTLKSKISRARGTLRAHLAAGKEGR